MSSAVPAPTSGRLQAPSRAAWRRLMLFAVGMFGVALPLRYFWLDRDMGTGPAGPPVPRQAFSRVWSERPVKLVGLGDSVTDGYGASQGHSYFDRLVQNPPDEFPDMRGICLKAVFPNLTEDNRAISGSTSNAHLKVEIHNLPVADPQTLGLVVMTTGGNDIIHNYGQTPPRENAMFGATWDQAQPWIRSFERRLDTMVEELKDRFPGGCRIFLANIYDPTDDDGTAGVVGLPSWPDGLRIHAAYNAAIARCAEKNPGVYLVDIHSALLGHGIYCRQFWRKHYHSADPHYWFYGNFEDPNDRGYDCIRRVFLNRMTQVLDPPEWSSD